MPLFFSTGHGKESGNRIFNKIQKVEWKYNKNSQNFAITSAFILVITLWTSRHADHDSHRYRISISVVITISFTTSENEQEKQ